MPPHARAISFGRGHRFAAYPPCSADVEVRVRKLSKCGSAVLTLVCVGCASVPARAPRSADIWEQQGCFSQILPDSRQLESSKLEGSVFTAGYSPSEFPIPVAVVYARRWPDGKVMTVDVDKDGRFVMPDVPEGLYELGVCANGWKPWRGTVRIRRDGPSGRLALPLELGM